MRSPPPRANGRCDNKSPMTRHEEDRIELEKMYLNLETNHKKTKTQLADLQSVRT